MAQMPVVEEGAEPPPYFPRTLVTQSVGTITRSDAYTLIADRAQNNAH